MHVALACLLIAIAAFQETPLAPSPENTLTLDINKSAILENRNGVKRVATASPDIAEAVAVSQTEVMVNGKSAGDTSLILWDGANTRTIYNVSVRGRDRKSEIVQEELNREFPGSDVSFRADNGAVFLRGTVDDTVAADRAVAITSSLGKVVNLLRVDVPEAPAQILLHVRFANVDRSVSSQLGLNLISTGALNTSGAISTGQFGSTTVDKVPEPRFTVTDALNIFLYRPDLNLGATLAALVSHQLAEILAEPNLLTLSGKPANFLAGGEFPFPTLQGGGGGVGQVTIQFREFGIRIHFLPFVTARGTIRMSVTPEVSSLDYGNGLTVGGFTVPGLATRRVETEIELANGQSFVIGGLLDNRVSESLNKIPGLGDIPLLGKIFQSKVSSRNHNELLVIVTPEIVGPLEAGEEAPKIPMPAAFLAGGLSAAPANPAASPEKVHLPRLKTIPVELANEGPDTAAPKPPTPPASPVAPPTRAAAAPPVQPAQQGPSTPEK